MLKYDVILMDIDDTITDDFKSRKNGYIEVCNSLKMKYNQERFEAFIEYDNKFWKDLEKGKISMPCHVETFEQKIEWQRAQRFMANFGVDYETAKVLNLLYCEKLADDIVIIEGAAEFIKYLASKYRLVIATNGPAIAATAKLENVGVLEYFCDVVVAEEVKSHKPKREFFTSLMKKIGHYNTNRMAILGDSIHSDIYGGILMGMDTYWFNPNNMEAPKDLGYTYEYKSYKELYNIF